MDQNITFILTTDTKIDIGLDTKMFNNKLEVIADYYNNTRKDLLISGTPVSGTARQGVYQLQKIN